MKIQYHSLRQYLISAVGCLIIGIGIGVNLSAGLGTDPMTVLLAGTYWRLGITAGAMNLLISLCQAAAAFALAKPTVSLATLFGLAAVSGGIDLWFLLPLPAAVWPGNLLWLGIGILIYAFGTALSQSASCGYSAYDAIIFALQIHAGFSYRQLRWGLECGYLTVGWLLGGRIGLGTILIFLLTGPLVEYFLKRMKQQRLQPAAADNTQKEGTSYETVSGAGTWVSEDCQSGKRIGLLRSADQPDAAVSDLRSRHEYRGNDGTDAE